MRLYPETQAIWKTLKLVLSLFNDTFRQNPKQTIWNLTPGCNLQRCHFSHWRRPSASVNLNFLYEPMHPTCKAQSNICKKFHNKPRESHFVTISCLLIVFERQNKASEVPFIWKSDFCYMPLSCDFSTVNSTSQGIFGLCCLNESIFSFSFFCKAGMWLAFQPRKHEGSWCPFSYGTSLGLSLQ